ncbi:MAG: hypothetical protein VW378_03505 [bacterium]
MFIFYDFETSSKELLGQILSYAFIQTDENYNEIQRLTGLVKLNRTQLPDVGAILTNKLNIDQLNKEGDTEYNTAHKIYSFLEQAVTQNKQCYLCGFNSNSFDLNFLRNLLIRHGINPYFKGQLKNKDILHYAQDIAITQPDNFPWHSLINNDDPDSPFYSFKLEKLATTFNCTNNAQSHDAIEDVELSISLIKALEKTFKSSFKHFNPIHIQHNPLSQETLSILAQPTRAIPEKGKTPITHTHWLYLNKVGKQHILLNLDQAMEHKERLSEQETLLNCLRSMNENKHYFKAAPCSDHPIDPALIDTLLQNPYVQSIKKSPKTYYDMIKKDWDIEYQIHEMGFDLIPKLKTEIDKLKHNPESYTAIIKDFLNGRKNTPNKAIQQTFNYCMQLFNRYYLNQHPNPDKRHMTRYIEPRYITGELLRDWNNFQPPSLQYETLLDTIKQAKAPNESAHLLPLKALYETFCKTHNIPLNIPSTTPPK